MATGVEAAGFVLAVLPLVVNQLDQYVQGIETIKSFRTRRYRRELKSWHVNLGSQKTIFENNILILLSDIDTSDESVAEFLKSCRRSGHWDSSQIEKELQKYLGASYDIYMANMHELQFLVQQVNEKFGLNPESVEKVRSWEDTKVFERELQKFKDIFSKSVYEKLLSKIKDVNLTLQTLTQQSRELQQVTRKRNSKPQKGFLIYQKIRKHARSLHNAVVGAQCWERTCKHQHHVNLRLEPRGLGSQDHNSTEPQPRFRMTMFSKSAEISPNRSWTWQEVEIEPIDMAGDANLGTIREQHLTTKSVAVASRRKVRFAEVMPIVGDTSELSTGRPIMDIWSALATVGMNCQRQECIGFLTDQTDKQSQHRIYIVKAETDELQTRSLDDILATSRSVILRPKERLYLAATLASSVLQLHGSWLKPQWRTRDILFPKNTGNPSPALDHPYLSWNVPSNHTDKQNSSQTKSVGHPLIRCNVLLPLGLALVELSLGQRLTDLRIPMDDHPVEAVASLTTATRLLDAGEIIAWSGPRYHDVVKDCLQWSGDKDEMLDDEIFQRAVFELIVSPLLENLRDFEARGQIR